MSFFLRLGAGAGAGAGACALFRLASSSLSTVRSMQSAISFHSAAQRVRSLERVLSGSQGC